MEGSYKKGSTFNVNKNIVLYTPKEKMIFLIHTGPPGFTPVGVGYLVGCQLILGRTVPPKPQGNQPTGSFRKSREIT